MPKIEIQIFGYHKILIFSYMNNSWSFLKILLDNDIDCFMK